MTSSSTFPLDEYYQRLQITPLQGLSIDNLASLQEAQAQAIPFENFDILLGRGIALEPDRVIEKLLRSHRGGYCFELNGLFLSAVQAMGYEARALLGRVHVSGQPSGRSHQVTLIRLDERDWVIDVGFGSACPRQPLQLDNELPSVQTGMTYRLCQHELGYMLQCDRQGDWQNLYSFDLCPVVPMDITYGNHFTSTHPASFFTFARVAAITTADGRKTLYNTNLTTISRNREETVTIPEGELYLNCLKDAFGIELDANYEDLKPLPKS